MRPDIVLHYADRPRLISILRDRLRQQRLYRRRSLVPQFASTLGVLDRVFLLTLLQARLRQQRLCAPRRRIRFYGSVQIRNRFGRLMLVKQALTHRQQRTHMLGIEFQRFHPMGLRQRRVAHLRRVHSEQIFDFRALGCGSLGRLQVTSRVARSVCAQRFQRFSHILLRFGTQRCNSPVGRCLLLIRHGLKVDEHLHFATVQHFKFFLGRHIAWRHNLSRQLSLRHVREPGLPSTRHGGHKYLPVLPDQRHRHWPLNLYPLRSFHIHFHCRIYVQVFRAGIQPA